MSLPAIARAALRVLAILGALLLLCSLGASAYMEIRFARDVVPLSQLPRMPVALVFGAGLAAGGEPSPLLAERLDMAAALYATGKVPRLLLSGNAEPHHDEVRAMRRYLLGAGVPEGVLIGDLGGFSTFDSCWRAREVFGVERAVLVTQRFHLPRALFLARAGGMQALGVAAGSGTRWTARTLWRELLARPLAVMDALAHPPPRPPAATPVPG